MALNARSMANRMKAAMRSKGFDPDGQYSVGDDWWLALSEAIVESIQQDARAVVNAVHSYESYPSIQKHEIE